jgi:catechol 2,3-dioxygenase-like lactoylglutathione lyase family enzyme
MTASPFFDRKAITQLCFVTDDLEKTAKWFGEFLGMPVPEFIISGTRAEADTEYRGSPSEARCRMAFFKLENLDIEIIEPDEHPSCWRDFLEKNGPGMHHLAFKVDGMKTKIAAFDNAGYPLLQKGEFTGGRYAYVDTEPQLGMLIELLEIDRPRA